MANGTEIQKVDPRVATLQAALAQGKKSIASLLPAHIKPEMLLRTVFTSVTATPALLKCDPVTIVRATLQAAMLGLPPNDGRGLAYLVPYGNTAQLITGYRGLVLLARQEGSVGAIEAATVHEGDDFDYEMGLTPRLRHRKAKAPAYAADGKALLRPIVGAYCVASVGGERQFTFLEWWEIERIRNASQGYRYAKSSGGSSPWIEHVGAMAQKTAVRAAMKFLPGSGERLAAAQRIDDASDRGEQVRMEAWFSPDEVADPGGPEVLTEGPATGTAALAASDPTARGVQAILAASDPEQVAAAHAQAGEMPGVRMLALDDARRKRLAELGAR